ncbi:MAG: DUF1214 domain-containing protein [Tatlockia sp.]|nr:DUF1214 domain-containing protein [Tatlockia sp.]
MTPWQILGIEETNNIAEIKKAYVTKIKLYKPEVDPEGFKLLRNAYELALKFAKGEQISFEIDPVQFQKSYLIEEHSGEFLSVEPDDFVLDLLHLLSTGQEQEALRYFQEMVENGQLDNLAFSEQFQELIVPRLIDKEAPEFTTYLFHFFQWQNHPAIDKELLFGIALRTLIKQTAYYRFLQALKAKSLIATKAQAEEQGIDWNQCRAIKAFLNPKKQGSLALQMLFSRKKRKATNALLDELNNYRKIYSKSYLDDNLLSWWTKYGSTKLHTLRLSLGLLFIIAYVINIGIKHKIINISANNVTEQTSQNQLNTNAQSMIPSTNTHVLITFSDYQGQKLSDSNQYILTIPPVKNGINTELSWSIMLFDKNYKLLKLISSTQPVNINKDGSIDIYLQPEKPSDKGLNWMATSKGNFIVTGSFYWKKEGEIINYWSGLKLAAIEHH